MTFERGVFLFKCVVYGLLAINVVLFFRHTTLHEGLDAIGWLMLLAVFEWETRRGSPVKFMSQEKRLLGALQIFAAVLILYSWVQFVRHEQWLDWINATVWILVVALMALDIYAPSRSGSAQYQLQHALKIVLYSTLLLVAALWGMRGSLLNFYDAALWIVCFFAIELNLLRHVRALR